VHNSEAAAAQSNVTQIASRSASMGSIELEIRQKKT